MWPSILMFAFAQISGLTLKSTKLSRNSFSRWKCLYLKNHLWAQNDHEPLSVLIEYCFDQTCRHSSSHNYHKIQASVSNSQHFIQSLRDFYVCSPVSPQYFYLNTHLATKCMCGFFYFFKNVLISQKITR